MGAQYIAEFFLVYWGVIPALHSTYNHNILSRILSLFILVDQMAVIYSEALVQEIWMAALRTIYSSFWEMGRMNISTLRAGIEVT